MLRRLVYCVSDHVAKTLSFKTTPNTTWFTLRVTTQYLVKRVLISTQLRHHDHNFLPQLSTSLGKLPRFACSNKDMQHQLQHFSMRFHFPAKQVYRRWRRGTRFNYSTESVHDGGGSPWPTWHGVSSAISYTLHGSFQCLVLCLVRTVQTSELAHFLFCSVLVNFSRTDQGTCTYSVLNSSCNFVYSYVNIKKNRQLWRYWYWWN